MALQYFTGKRTAGYVVVADPDMPEVLVEMETKMCAHCGYHGLYNPGNVKKYAKYAGHANYINGVCFACHGLVCALPECNERCLPLEQRLEETETGKRKSF